MAIWWKRRKTFAMLNNRKQWQRDFDPYETTAQEILMEHLTSHWLVTEASDPGTPTYIITE
jgi:hypothetical protein